MKVLQKLIRLIYIVKRREVRILKFFFIVFFLKTHDLKAQFVFHKDISCFGGNGCSVSDLVFSSRDTAYVMTYTFLTPTSGGYYSILSSFNSAMSFNGIYSSGTFPNLYYYNIYDGKNNYIILRTLGGLSKILMDGTGQNNFCNSSFYPVQDLHSIDSLHHYILFQNYGTNYSSCISVCNGLVNTFLDTIYGIDALDIFFPDTTHGFILGQDTITHHNSTILRSDNGGANWHISYQDTSSKLIQMIFVSSQVGYACGDSGLVIKTTDGGISWQEVNIPLSKRLNGIAFQNDTLGFVVGDQGFIMKTVNGAISWQADTVPTIHSFRSIMYAHPGTFYAFTQGWDELYVYYSDSLIGIWDEYQLNRGLLVAYPNPSAGKLALKIPEEFWSANAAILKLHNCMGVQIREWPIDGQISELNLELQDVPRGMYNLVLTGAGFQASAKITLE